MAQAELRPTNIVSGNKIRIKLKGLSARKGGQAPGLHHALQNGLEHLADLHAAVEAFCQQGVRSLPGAMLLSPWREPVPYESLPEQQVLQIGAITATQQQQPTHEQLQLSQPQQPAVRQRVRKRRVPDADQLAAGAAGPEQLAGQQLAWGDSKRRRSVHHRPARDTAQLSNSIHSMLQPSSAPGSPSVVSQPVAACPAGRSSRHTTSGSKPAAAKKQPQSRLKQASTEPAAVPMQEAGAVEVATMFMLEVDGVAPMQAHAEGNAASIPEQEQHRADADQRRDQAAVANQTALGASKGLQQPQMQPLQRSTAMHDRVMQDQEANQKQQQGQEEQQPMQVDRQLSAPVARALSGVAAVDVASGVQAQKADSPPSETSHQQRIAPQHLRPQLPQTELPAPEPARQQQLQPQPVKDTPQPMQQQVQVEQTAVSRDRSQCSLPRTDAAAGGAAAVNMPAPASTSLIASAVGSVGGTPASGRLLELAPASMTPAARALAVLTQVPEVKQRCLPPEGVGKTQEEALQYLSSMMDKAKQLKHQGDKRHNMLGNWDVFGLAHYALSTVEFLLYWDTALRLLSKLKAANQPVEKLQQQINNLSGVQFLRQTGALSTTAMNTCSNCKGSDVAKQALRMLLERLSAICNLRNLHNQRKQLEGHIRLLKSGGSTIGSSSSNSSVRMQQQQQQQSQQGRLQVQAQRAAAAVTSGKPPSPGGSSWSPAGQQAFNKRSPDDSNASNQERVQLSLVGDQGAAALAGGPPAASAGAAVGVPTERALQLAKSERHLMDTMQELLRMTDGMHQTVMRMQQFLESPDVLSSEHARAAALHISVLGLDAGMFSIPRIAAHTEAAVMSITKLLRSS